MTAGGVAGLGSSNSPKQFSSWRRSLEGHYVILAASSFLFAFIMAERRGHEAHLSVGVVSAIWLEVKGRVEVAVAVEAYGDVKAAV